MPFNWLHDHHFKCYQAREELFIHLIVFHNLWHAKHPSSSKSRRLSVAYSITAVSMFLISKNHMTQEPKPSTRNDASPHYHKHISALNWNSCNLSLKLLFFWREIIQLSPLYLGSVILELTTSSPQHPG